MSIDELIARSRVWRGSAHGSASKTIATGYPALDRFLPGGGWPCDAVTEVVFERHGSGELSLVMPALAALSRRGGEDRRWIVWIAPPLVPYAPALAQHGLNLERVLLVHPRGARRDVLWAAEQSIRSGSSIALLAWLDRASDTALRRLQLGAEERECLTVLFRPPAALESRSPAALRLKLSPAARGTRIEVLKCRGRRPGSVDVELAALDSRAHGNGPQAAAEAAPETAPEVTPEVAPESTNCR